MNYDLGIPNLRVGELIGGGGFAQVYRAHDSLLKRDLAIKILRPVMGQDASATFTNEAGLHGRLSRHANIVTIHHAGFTADGAYPFLVMDLVTGGSLGDQLDRLGTIPWQQAVTWMIPICRAVQHVHDSGILHRDIKPDNILLDPPNTPLLGDLGIACLEDDTRPIEAMSFPHVAPEGLRGMRREAPSDVFSLGTTLYQLLTGRAPFGHSYEERIAKLGTAAPPLPEESWAPIWLDMLLQRALDDDPTLRIQSARELETALQAGLDAHHSPTSAPAVSPASERAAEPPASATSGDPVIAIGPRGRNDQPAAPDDRGERWSLEPDDGHERWSLEPDDAHERWSLEPLYFQAGRRRRRPQRLLRPLLRGVLGIALGVILLVLAIAVIEGVRASDAFDGWDFDFDPRPSTDDESPPVSDSFGSPANTSTTVTPTTGEVPGTTQTPTTRVVPTTIQPPTTP